MKLIGLAALLLIVIAAAYMFRYEPVPTSAENPMAHGFVWDRWSQRMCLTNMNVNNQILCSREELSNYWNKQNKK